MGAQYVVFKTEAPRRPKRRARDSLWRLVHPYMKLPHPRVVVIGIQSRPRVTRSGQFESMMGPPETLRNVETLRE
jgi:hypothetical protein